MEWHFGRKGQFSMRSAYELFMQHLEEAGTSLRHTQDRDILPSWNFLWRAKVPPKVLLLAWRACQEAIPVCYNLRRRGLNIPILCIWCGHETEDVLHVLLRCSFSRQTRALSGLPWHWINSEANNTEEWMRAVWKEINGSDFLLFLVIFWNLWWSLNQLAFEAIPVSPLEVAGTLLRHAQDRDFLPGWNFLWRAKVPPKVLLLAWRACQEAIPVCYNLRRRGLNIPILCILCGHETEDVLHVLLRCSFSRQVWALSGLPWRWISSEANNIEEWMRAVWKEINGSDFSLFLVICSNLWWSRNQLAFEAIPVSPVEVITLARRYLTVFFKDPMVTIPNSE
ncbi:UNVERIFIED_CONTAM: hypothetical protein Sradi_0741700 [Sesamum radiatum]|uniref:Reverse transcriptase zinc-binding domain-containing protein n=1 Tax=Sesamum radiatum TaxID=300843 RepID=A0AAW2VNV0_SESRA